MTSYIIATTLTVLFFISPTLLPTVNAYNIRDSSGNQVMNGANYYIRSNTPGPDDGSITWAYNASTTQNCPLFTTTGYYTYTPASVTSYQSSKYIPLGASVYITFLDNTSPCHNNQLSWSAMQSDSIANAVYVVAGYQLPSFDYGVFQVVDSGINQKNVYKFIYCTDDYGCMDVGWLANSSDPYLAMTTDSTMELNPFYFVFDKY